MSTYRETLRCYKTNLIHCHIKEVTGKKRGNGPTTCVEAKDGKS